MAEAAKGASGVKVGDHVWYSADGVTELIGHVVKPEHDNGVGELKAVVQAPQGGHVVVGYREPKDRDDNGSGGTFWLI